VVVAFCMTACATATCTPRSFVVAKKEERARVANVSEGLYRTGPTGRLDPVETPGVVREYWVRSAVGEWYRVSEEQFERAEVDRPFELCQ
jgi:hypothetical protein